MYTIEETPFMKRYRHPVNAVKKDEDTEQYTITAADNPKCGDDVLLYLDIRDGVIVGGRYAGDSCAVCTVSADTLIDAVRGKTLQEAKEISNRFARMFYARADEKDLQMLGAAAVMREIVDKPSRRQCAMLPWGALERAIEQETKGGRKCALV